MSRTGQGAYGPVCPSHVGATAVTSDGRERVEVAGRRFCELRLPLHEQARIWICRTAEPAPSCGRYSGSRQRIDTPAPRAIRCSASWGRRTALRCARLHRFPAAAFFYPVFYPKRLRSRAEMSYLLVRAAKSRGSAGVRQQLPKLIVRVRFPSPDLRKFPLYYKYSIYCSPDCSLMPTARSSDAHLKRFPCLYQYFRTELCWHEGPAGTHISTQSAGASKLGIQVRFHRPLHRRSLQRDAQNTGMAMNPHWLQGFPRRPRHWRDPPDRAVGTEDKTGPDAGHAPQCRTHGRPWILPPDALAIQPGSPLEASAGDGPERRQGLRKSTARAVR